VRAVIGLGINVRMPAAVAASIDQPWIDLAGLQDPPPSRNRIAATLLAHLVPALDQFDAEGLAPFLARYARFDALAGRQVAIHLGAAVQAGVALGIAGDGALRVDIGGEERLFHAGEVSVRPQ
jgi:BirA family biotin operon repressor/biotin-[acetyl-CoA-carboxylase] ligase